MTISAAIAVAFLATTAHAIRQDRLHRITIDQCDVDIQSATQATAMWEDQDSPGNGEDGMIFHIWVPSGVSLDIADFLGASYFSLTPGMNRAQVMYDPDANDDDTADDPEIRLKVWNSVDPYPDGTPLINKRVPATEYWGAYDAGAQAVEPYMTLRRGPANKVVFRLWVETFGLTTAFTLKGDAP